MSCGNEYEYQKEILDRKIERTNNRNKKRELKREKRELTKKPKMK